MDDNAKEARKEATERVREAVKRDNAEIAERHAEMARLQEQVDLRNLETSLRLKAAADAAAKGA